jgi:hypothetical protein
MKQIQGACRAYQKPVRAEAKSNAENKLRSSEDFAGPKAIVSDTLGPWP